MSPDCHFTDFLICLYVIEKYNIKAESKSSKI